jgi:hypothetical protein
MVELLQVDPESVVELGNGAGEHNRPPARVLLDDREAVLVRELPDRLEIGRIRPELLVVLLMGQVTLGFVTAGYFPHSLLQFVLLTMAEDHCDLQPFRGVCLRHCPGARQWRSLAADERFFWHSSTLLGLLTCAAQDLRAALQRHEAAAEPNSKFLWRWLLGWDSQTTRN